MPTAREMLFVALAIFSAGYLWIWFTGRGRAPGAPSLLELGIGFITNFFDRMGSGSFAPTASMFKFWKIVPDERIPGTLNVGHTPPTILEAFLFIAIVQVDMLTLVLLIGGAVVGAWLGAGIVAGWPRRKVQIGMGAALLAAASFLLMANLNLFPAGGSALILWNCEPWVARGGSGVCGELVARGV